MEITVKKTTKKPSLSSRYLKDLATYVLTSAKISPQAEVSIALVGKEKIKELNLKYRGKKAVTDVLSFSFEEEEKEEPFLLGEVVISPEVARKQARGYGNSFKKELSLLVVHGLLHLLGYDHQSSQKSKVMKQKERAILSKFFREKTS